jgi:predicted RNase H-like HicB family nuclease
VQQREAQHFWAFCCRLNGWDGAFCFAETHPTFSAGGAEMIQYFVVLERTELGYSAYFPDLPGCVSTGATRQETIANIQDAIEFHIEGMKLEGLPIPMPQSQSAYVEIAA